MDTSPFCFLPMNLGEIRTDSSATVRWTVAATSLKTGGYIDFCPVGRNANRIPHPLPNINRNSDTKGLRFLCFYDIIKKKGGDGG